jgi:hypothetical protein
VGVAARTDSEEKPRSQNRDLGHPLKVWRLQFVFRQSAVERSAVLSPERQHCDRATRMARLLTLSPWV